jgi:hypothetical protein
MSDAFDGAQEIAPSQVSFGKIGDYIIGYYTGHKDITTSNGDTKLYELKGIQGEFHITTNEDDGNGNKIVKVAKDATPITVGDYFNVWGGKSAIDDLFKKVKIGQKVGVRFEEAIPSKKKGNSAFKVFKTVMWDEMDPSDPLQSTFPGAEELPNSVE